MASFILEQEIARRLSDSHEDGEAKGIARILSGYLRDRYGNPEASLIDEYVERVAHGEPVQYVVGYTWFYDSRFEVNRHVLIPRPETEELVDWVIRDLSESSSPVIADIGTGSGCIGISIAKNIPGAKVDLIDISRDALDVTSRNAKKAGVPVSLIQLDFLISDPGQHYDVIVSNPPYIGTEELAAMSPVVRDHEPVAALVPNHEDVLVFYCRLRDAGLTHLTKGGSLYMELNEFRAFEIQRIFIESGFQTDLRKDMQGKWRMLKCMAV